jgi:group I intron endonuclease
LYIRIISGIYKIVNQQNGKFYVGSSKNIIRRWYIHKSALKNNRHHCIHLQRSWNKHGEQTFKFEIIKELDHPNETQLFAEELKYINELLPQYNVGGVGGEDNLTNNPNREDIIKRIVTSMKDRISKMSEEERKLIWGRTGDKNFNWKGGISSPNCKICGKKLGYGHNHCMLCSKLGINNPFYNKHHSNKTKKFLREINLGKLPTNIRSVKIEGTTYLSVADAARKIGVCNATILFRIKSKYWDYEYIIPQYPF